MPAKNELDAMLGGEQKKPPIRRGRGMQLSTEPQADAETQERINAATQESEIAKSQSSEIVETHNSDDAKVQEGENAVSQDSEKAKDKPKWKRVNRGYTIRDDLIKTLKRLALDDERNMYELMEDALQEYIERRKSSAA